ncbi:MAG: multicopper oxidase family protein [Deltaproteobacteria bacterium]|nr:multicopper oxidase family protein [Deltaproteobacteria bacterium]
MKNFYFGLGLACLSACAEEQIRPAETADAGFTEPSPDASSPADAGFAVDSGPEDAGATPPPYVPPEVQGVSALTDWNPDPNVVEVWLDAVPFTGTLYEGRTLRMFGYDEQVPGPILNAKVGDQVIVHFTNSLSEPTTIHWHGVRVPDTMDGSPMIQTPIETAGQFTYSFVVRDPGTFWYHPHVRANEQVEKGLYGMVVVHDPADPVLLERAIMLDDVLVNETGREPFLTGHMEVMHGRTGNLLLTNGRAELPKVSVAKGDVERWRIVNTANARTMQLTVTGASWRVVGTDGGHVAPFKPDVILLPVGQRYDLEVKYDQAGTAELVSHVLTQDASGNLVTEPIAVFQAEVADSDRTPAEIAWPTVERPERAPDQTVTLEFAAESDPQTGLRWMINGSSHHHEPLFTFQEGQTVRMKLRNLAGPEHPFHLHGQFFDIVDDGRSFTHQPGLKDVVLVPGGEALDIIAYLDNPGRWMAHCHILEHAEVGMMTEFMVEPTP